MLTINRFDASGGAAGNDDGSAGRSGAPLPTSSRLAALAERKRKREGDDAGAGASSSAGESRSSHLRDASTSAATAPTPRPTLPGPSIHPSRLASAPILAKEAKKAAAAAGIKKEKTKAKQRYLNKKKLRRKAKKKSGAKGSSGGTNTAKATAGAEGEDAESSDESSEDDSGDEKSGAGVAPASKKPKTQPGAETSVTAPPAVSSESDDSDSSSDSESASSSSSSGDSADDREEADEEAGNATGEAPSMTLAPLVRGNHLNHLSAEAMRSLASQGLPRGMVEPRLVDPSVRKAIEEVDEAQPADSGVGSVVEASLDRSLAKRLKQMGVVEWFAVQTAVIPHLLSTAAHPTPFSPPRDLCVSAPTGSGKTLAYSIPIVALLKHRVVTRLRALIILPTRDLVAQVRETLELLSKGTGLRIASTTGAQSFAQEQQLLVDEAMRESKLDVLVTTPGRLIDHLDGTPGFTLQHLRFLVIDEADRLLGQSFHNWAQRLRASIEGRDDDASPGSSMSTAQLHRRFEPKYDAACDPVQPQPVVQKLLFSATLTREPGKLSELGLRDPVFIDVREQEQERLQEGGAEETRMGGQGAARTSRYTLPATLREHMLVVPTSQKPLHLLHLLLQSPRRARAESSEDPSDGPMRRTLVFTKSVDSAHRLVHLIHLFFEESQRRGSLSSPSPGPALRVANYSSDLSPSARRDLLQSFREGRLDVLVASDLISRGIDLPLVENVISYDVPVDAAKYVHRVGRTARANREGASWALVEEQEARFFKRMMKAEMSRKGNEGVKKVKVSEGELRPFQEAYEAALRRLVAA